jgi:hypothetical protein
LEVRELPSAAPLLAISSNGRYLVNASNGQPFYLVGDTAWALPAGITTGSATDTNTANYYFSTRASQGYNAVLMDADVQLGASPVGAPQRGPLDVNGNAPFNGFLPGTNIYDVSTIPGASDTTSTAGRYWQNIHNIVAAAGTYGIEVVLDVYDNYNPWFTGGNSPNSTAKLSAYGVFLGNEFKDLPNVVWMLCNDYSENSAGDADLKAVIQGIRQNDTQHLGWAMDEYGATFDNTGLRSMLQLNSIYEYSPGPWRSLYLSQYNRSDFGPTFNLEAGYEFNTSLGVSEANLRDEHYSFLLAGATGDMYGNENIWPFDDAWRSWQSALTTEGAHEMTYLTNLVNSVSWYNLIPDQNGTVFQGVGSPSDYSGAYTSDGTLGLAYKPSTGTGSQSFNVNLAKFVGSVTAQWYDPTNGTYTSIGTFANSCTHTFTSPTTNSAGQNDFVLVLKSAATAPAAPTLSATAGDGQVALSWTSAAGASSYSIYRGTSKGGESTTTIATVTNTAYIDHSVSNGTTYWYVVKAVNSVGSTTSNEVSATPVLGLPGVPGNFTATAGNQQVTLSWNAASGTVTGYNIYRSTTKGGEGTTPYKSVSSTTTSFSDTGLTNGTTYYYVVGAANSVGESKTGEVSATPSILTYVQSSSTGSDAGAGSISQSFSTNAVAGNMIVVAVSWDTSTGNTTAPTITDSQGNTYTRATYANDTRHNQALAVFYAPAIKGGADTITATFPVSQSYRRLLIQEYAGLAGTVDVTSSNIGTGSVPTSNAATTTTAGDLIFGAFMDDSGTTSISAGTGFTQRQFVSSDSATEDMIQSSAGAIAATANFAASTDYLAQMVAFKAGGSITVTAPIIATQPSNQTVTAGQTAMFTATATGTPTPTLQWQVSANGGSTWSNIAGATTTTYSFTAAMSQSGNQFRAIFTNSAGSATSNAATLTVNAVTTAPTITAQPSNVTVTAGQTAMFTAAATGTPTPTVQWQVSTNGGSTFTNISGATATSYTFTAATSQSGNQYRAVFTNSAGSATSNGATLTVNAASQGPVFLQASANQTHTGSNSVTLGSTTTSGDTIVVEVDFASSASFTSISDNQGNTYVQIGTQQQSTSFGASSRLYYATNIKGGALAISSALTGTPSFHELYVNEYSGINPSSPLDGFSVNVSTGSSFTSNSVTTIAANDLLYGIEIDVATASAAAGWTARSSYDSNIDADRSASMAGSYAFTGTSSGSYIAWIAAFKDGSAAVTAPAIATQPTNATITAGQPATLTAVATGTSPLSYQWQKMVNGTWSPVGNGGDISGATTAILAFSASVAADAGQYRVIVTNSAGSATSSTATLTVNPAANVTMGETNVMPSDDNGNANLLLAQKTTLPQSGTLQSLSFYVTQAAGSLVLGVYDASGPNGGPGKLLAQTNSFTPVVGWNTVNVISPVHLTAGTYWLAYLPSDNNLHFRVDRTSGTLEWYSFAYGAMANTFSTTPNVETGHWSLFATLTPG